MVSNLRSNGDPFKDIWDAIYRLRNASPQNSMSVDDGKFQVRSAEGVDVADGGSLVVRDGGGVDIQDGGSLNVDGSGRFGGDVEIIFTLKVGATSEFTGAVSLKSDMTLDTGRIIAGNAILSSDEVGGQLASTSDLNLAAANQLGLYAGSSVFVGADLVANGEVSLNALPTITGVTSNLYLDGTTLKKIV